MAWRINESVVRGEIDNRVRGHVKGSIWLQNRKEPVTLELLGNCRRDLAGCFVRFKNPGARSTNEERTDLATKQEGVAGDITASRKVRVFDVPLEEACSALKAGKVPPERTGNCFYLEWFSDASGRVVIESTDYQMDVSTPAWTLSPEEEQEQITTTQQAMRDWLDRLDEARTEQREHFDADEEKPLDEFGYEKFMRESDARTDKYMKLLEKYEGHPDKQKIVAREMGWTWLEEALEADERRALPPSEPMEIDELVPNPLTEGVDWVRDKEDGHIHHPLTKQTFESSMAMYHYCNDRKLLESDGNDDIVEMVFQFQTCGAKIAGALDGLAYDDDLRDGAFIVAALKRALGYLHKSISASEKVSDKRIIEPERLESFRQKMFDIREEMLALMKRFREE